MDLAQARWWEAQWAPYDEQTYQTALQFIQPEDIVLDIGAGDLRFARRAAAIATHVFAIERQTHLLPPSTDLPLNLTPLPHDARTIDWPEHVTVGVLLMRHCTHIRLYARRLRSLGCRRLITNARWRMDVEQMDLGQRLAWSKMLPGWFACLCGNTGFVSGPPAQTAAEAFERVTEVEFCPACQRQGVKN